MSRLDIRLRMLLTALLPVVMVSAMLAIFFIFARFDDLQESYQERTRSVVRQLAMASEFGLFSGNPSQLQAVVSGVLREPDVIGVVVLDKGGQLLAHAGDASAARSVAFVPEDTQVFDEKHRVDILGQAVFATGLVLDNLYEETAARSPGLSAQLGQVVVAFSRQSVDRHKKNMLFLGGISSLSGIIFGVLLALWLSRGVIRPILRVTNLIERIGRGDFSAAAQVRIDNSAFGDPLGELQTTLHHMAKRLAHARDDLEMQVSTATQTMREKMEEAEQATQAKTRFLAAASHDLRQPTHALGLFVTRLAQLSHDEQTRGLIVNLQASVLAMQNLLDSLLDISRLEAKAVSVKCQPFFLADLMTQLQQDLGQQALDKGLRLRIRPTSLHASSDATLVYRILLNLVGNALRYTLRGGVLVVCRERGGGQLVQIQVWDTGIGIPPEHQQDIFKEFYQIGNAGRDRNKGLGLGLSIVQRTADLLEHPVGLTSRTGVGSRFTLTLPAAQVVPDLDLGPGVNQASQHDLNGVSVWVIEDDEMVLTALVGLLEDWGMRVQAARDLQSAGKLVDAGLTPDLILSDYRLQQGQNGIEVIQQLRSRLNSQVPSCLMSGNTDADLMAAAQEAELTLLHKPVRPAKLRNLMRRLLMKGQILDEDLR